MKRMFSIAYIFLFLHIFRNINSKTDITVGTINVQARLKLDGEPPVGIYIRHVYYT